LPYVHHENEFVDFDREPLIPKLLSTEGPMLAVADVNGDGLDDMFIGGAKGQAGKLLIQQPDGRFVSTNEKAFEQDRLSEDLGAVFFDADGDGHPDLYVVSGGSEFASSRDPALQDRLYLNDGRGRLRNAIGSLPPDDMSGSRVVAADYDGDGDVDLFVGGRVVPWHYGVDPRSMLLQNDGHGRFTDVTKRLAPDLERVGMVTDAGWRDELITALPYLKPRYPRYADYAGQTVTDIFSPTELAGATWKQAHTFATALVRNNGDGSFTLVPLPLEAQLAPVYGILAQDVDR